MKHQLWEIFKNPDEQSEREWCVQLPGGIDCFKTKKEAEAMADGAEKYCWTEDDIEFLPSENFGD